MAEVDRIITARMRLSRPRPRGLGATITGVIFIVIQSTHAQSLSVPTAAQLAGEHAPTVNPGTLLAFAWHESRLRPFAIHDNDTGESAFPASAAEAAGLARARSAQGHSLDLGIM